MSKRSERSVRLAGINNFDGLWYRIGAGKVGEVGMEL